MPKSRVVAALSLGLLASCGGASPTPPPPVQTFSLQALVFYDENGNGLQDGNEAGVVPGAVVEVAGRTGQAAPGTGQATLTRVPAGKWPAKIRPDSLPPFYRVGPAVEVTVPVADGQPVRLPATLPIGSNRPSVYMAFGDSITDGDGSEDETGYRARLESSLRAHFGLGTIENQAIGGTRSHEGAARIATSLGKVNPSYTLILYGTNDWNDPRCRSRFPCFTINSLRSMIRSVKGAGGLPVLSTIIPVNTGFDARAPESRNVWVSQMNDLLRPMAQEEGAVLADSYAAFMAVPDFHTLFFDHVHPNDAGYDILAGEFFKAVTEPPPIEPTDAARAPAPLLSPPEGAFPESIPDDPADVPRPPRWGEGEQF